MTLKIASETLLISQDETSEAFIGEWAEKRGIRDQLVIATKVFTRTFYVPYSVNVETRLSILQVSSEGKMILTTRLIMRETMPSLSTCP
jgi:aryl-alcohol dehydrogenase-like predicted oxidoreductase